MVQQGWYNKEEQMVQEKGRKGISLKTLHIDTHFLGIATLQHFCKCFTHVCVGEERVLLCKLLLDTC